MSKFDPRAVMTEIKANIATLEACRRHHFSATEARLGQRLACDLCGGSMYLTDVGNYIRGYEAGGGSATDIWPAWRTSGRGPITSSGETK